MLDGLKFILSSPHSGFFQKNGHFCGFLVAFLLEGRQFAIFAFAKIANTPTASENEYQKPQK